MMNNSRNYLCAMAVFGQLYDQNHSIVDVITTFIRDVVSLFDKSKFSEIKVQDALRQKYDFELPTAVVRTVLNQLSNAGELTSSEKVYSISNVTRNEEIEALSVNVKSKHSVLIEDLRKFINELHGNSLREADFMQIEKDLIAFFAGDKMNLMYGTDINAYLVSIRADEGKVSNFNLIKEGIVLYTGLAYEPGSMNTIGEWDNNLTIFLDTEILFFLAGYHGSVHKNAVQEFINIVAEVNAVAKPNTGIKLAYFRDNGDEIDKYFHAAEGIVNGTILDNGSSTAMYAIISGCKFSSDVVGKKAAFFDMLEKQDINEYDLSDFNDAAYQKYGIEKAVVCSPIASKNIDLDLEFLSYINYLRKGKNNKGFYNSGYLLITETNSVLNLALDSGIKNEKEVALAFNLVYVTTRLWMKLNKSLSHCGFPKSLDVIANAQIALSNQLQGSVARRFDELKTQEEQNTLDESSAIKAIALLRSRVLNPEDITENNLSDTLCAINETSIEEALRNQELRDIELREAKNRNDRLADEKNALISQSCEKEDTIAAQKEALIKVEEERNHYKDIVKGQEERKTSIMKTLKIVGIFVVLAAVIVIAFVLSDKYPRFTQAITIAATILDLVVIGVGARRWIAERFRKNR